MDLIRISFKRFLIVLVLLSFASIASAQVSPRTIQLRRDTVANWTSFNPVLSQGEPAYETDTGLLKIGDGLRHYNSLPYLTSVAAAAWGSITGNITDQPDLNTALSGKASTSTTINGHALSSNVTISASDITTGTLPHAQLPSLISGDIPNNAANTTGTSGGLTGTPNISVGTVAASGDITTDITGGGVQCVQASNTGVLSGTGGVCGAGGGGANASGYYLVGQATNSPANAINLGLLSTGFLKLSISGGVATMSSDTNTYAPATSGSSILKGNGSGGFSNASSGTDYAPATSGSSILKGNGAGGFSNASAGTDYENPLTFNAPLSRTTNAISLGTVGVANGGTGIATAAVDTAIMGAGTTTPFIALALPTTGTNGCAGTLDKLLYNTTTHAFACGVDQTSGGGTGITTLNTLTPATQSFAVGTTGTDFNIASATATHTFHLPDATAAHRGALTSADWTTFNAKEPAISTSTSPNFYRWDKTFAPVTFDLIGTGVNTSAVTMTVSTGSSLTYASTGIVNANKYKGNATIAAVDGGTGVSSTATFPSSGTVATTATVPAAGTCTNQSVTALTNGSAPTCTTLTSAYVNNSIALTGTDINTASQVIATHLTSPLPEAQGGTGISSTATFPSSGTIIVAGADLNTSNQVTSTHLISALPVAQGGTGQTTYTNGQLLIGNTTGNTLAKATLTAGTGISITNGTGSITIANTGATAQKHSLIQWPSAVAVADQTYVGLPWSDYTGVDTSFTITGTNQTRITVPSGVTKVKIALNASWDSNATGTRVVKLTKNGGCTSNCSTAWQTATYGTFVGAFYDRGSPPTGGGGGITNHNVTTGVLEVTAGDYFEVLVWQSSGGSLNIEGQTPNYTWVNIESVD